MEQSGQSALNNSNHLSYTQMFLKSSDKAHLKVTERTGTFNETISQKSGITKIRHELSLTTTLAKKKCSIAET